MALFGECRRCLKLALEKIHASSKFTVFRLKNKFRKAAGKLVEKDGEWKHPEGVERVFPNLHLNVLFKADECAPMVAEVQLHLHEVLELAKQDHKLFEVKRAEKIGDLLEEGHEVIRKVRFSTNRGHGLPRRTSSVQYIVTGARNMARRFTHTTRPPELLSSDEPAPQPVETDDVTVKMSGDKIIISTTAYESNQNSFSKREVPEGGLSPREVEMRKFHIEDLTRAEAADI